jgi:hypothetical protein
VVLQRFQRISEPPYGRRSLFLGRRNVQEGSRPLHVLLNHSDCEGCIEVDDCIPLADRLEEVTASWWANDEDRHETVLLIEGLRAASVRGEVLKSL